MVIETRERTMRMFCSHIVRHALHHAIRELGDGVMVVNKATNKAYSKEQILDFIYRK